MQHLDNEHILPALYPVADAFAGTVATDIFEVPGLGAAFDIIKGVGTTGTSVITVYASDDNSASNTTLVPFLYRASTTPDTWGDWTAATTAGFTTTAGSNQMYQVYVNGGHLGATGYGYVKLVATESVDDPVVGCIIGRVIGVRNGEQPDSVLD